MLANDHFLLIAAGSANAALVELLVLYGADIQSALFILKSTMDIKQRYNEVSETKLTSYRNTVKLLLDNAMGVDFSSAKFNSDEYCGLDFLKHIDNIENFNFIGISLDGQPLTKYNFQKGSEKLLFTIDDLEQLTDLTRKQSLKNKLLVKFEALGKLINKEGVVNLVPLWRAAQTGDIEAVRARLTAGVSPNEEGYFGSPIETAAQYDNLEIIIMLASHPSINEEDITDALLTAINKGHKNVVKYLSTKCNLGIDELIEVVKEASIFSFKPSFREFLKVKQAQLHQLDTLTSNEVDLSELSSEWKKIKNDTVKLSELSSLWGSIKKEQEAGVTRKKLTFINSMQ
ncbi:MAG: hypothetical protein BGO90_08575 [Legionella sp. 40-6]|mgnify:CR=1 FL=1|nr:MAG: hypothetical protein BGO90_08575 [Legionella sp. 40-6]